MPNTKKNQEKGLDVILLSALTFVFLGSAGCHQNAPTDMVPVDRGDENVSAAKIAEAEPLYDGRENMAKARVAVAVLRQARTADYGNYEAAWKLSRADYYLAQHTESDDERQDLFREGIEAGKAAVQLQPIKPDGHFWLGANYGGDAEHSTLAGLANVEDIRREMEEVLKLDESYQSGSAFLGLGQLYLRAPRALGGDSGKAISYLEKGLKYGANNGLLHARLAEAYASVNRDADARKQVEVVLALTPDPKYSAEHKQAVAEAKKLQQKLDAKI
jgi:hypothetical protein